MKRWLWRFCVGMAVFQTLAVLSVSMTAAAREAAMGIQCGVGGVIEVNCDGGHLCGVGGSSGLDGIFCDCTEGYGETDWCEQPDW